MTAVTASFEENDNSKIGTRRWLLLGIAFLTSTLYAMTLLVGLEPDVVNGAASYDTM